MVFFSSVSKPRTWQAGEKILPGIVQLLLLHIFVTNHEMTTVEFVKGDVQLVDFLFKKNKIKVSL